jgi:hypothetical protein
MESQARHFPQGLKRFLRLRDLSCRTPWCDAPVRHGDHVVADHAGGATSAANGQAVCEACNYTKELAGWSAREGPGSRLGDHVVEVITPTGHVYRSRAPALHTPTARAGPRSLMETAFARVLRARSAA